MKIQKIVWAIVASSLLTGSVHAMEESYSQRGSELNVGEMRILTAARAFDEQRMKERRAEVLSDRFAGRCTFLGAAAFVVGLELLVHHLYPHMDMREEVSIGLMSGLILYGAADIMRSMEKRARPLLEQ